MTDHCNNYEIMVPQVRKINQIRKVIFCLRYGKPPSTLSQSLIIHQVEYLIKSMKSMIEPDYQNLTLKKGGGEIPFLGDMLGSLFLTRKLFTSN